MATPKTLTAKTATMQAMRFNGTPDKQEEVRAWVNGVIFSDSGNPILEYPGELKTQALGGGHVWYVAKFGDWLVQNSSGGFDVYTNEVIQEEYDVV